MIKFGRPFGSVTEMDKTMIRNWNAVVAPDDDIWHLGDFCYRSAQAPASYLRRLNGRTSADDPGWHFNFQSFMGNAHGQARRSLVRGPVRQPGPSARGARNPGPLARWAEASALARSRMTCVVDQAHGTETGETLDVFLAPQPCAPVLVFSHGGWWRALDKSDHSFVAHPWGGPLRRSDLTPERCRQLASAALR